MGTEREIKYWRCNTLKVYDLTCGSEKYNVEIDISKVNADYPRTDIYIYHQSHAYRILVQSFTENIEDGRLYRIIQNNLSDWVDKYNYYNQFVM